MNAMSYLNPDDLFSFNYAGKSFFDMNPQKERNEIGNTVTTVYTLDKGLKVTNILTKYPEYDAYEWVNWFENTSDAPTEIISELWDCNVSLPLKNEDEKRASAYIRDKKDMTQIYAPKGSDCSSIEFYCNIDEVEYSDFKGILDVGKTRCYQSLEGRSSQGKAPFFNIHKDGEGYVAAIGWSGQWNCEVTRLSDSAVFKSKIEDTHFVLLQGEKIRTSSVVIMRYEGSFIDAQNKWRRLVKNHFSLIGSSGRDKYGPLCASIWGGTTSAAAIERIKIIHESGIPVEYIWMDAGWYGINNNPTPNEFEGDWPVHAGDWRVSPKVHPNGLCDVSKTIHDMGMKFLLWFEPERVRKNTPIFQDHPEYCLTEPNINTAGLLNLGDEAAWQYCCDMLCEKIETIGIDGYRQDFNINPIYFWRHNDAEDRKGITEIKYVMGLYKLWDTLLERFPNLIIDNCSSGGRRIDIEMQRRSIPLWRSDAQCPANYDVRCSQIHHQTFNTWLPHSGTGTGREYDEYRARSTYDSSMTINHAFSESNNFGDDPEKLAWLKKMCEEYLMVRPYFCEDFYPLTQVSDCTDIWCASQFDRLSQNDGIVQIFRRENSPYEVMTLELHAIDESAEYTFTDADGGECIKISGAELKNNGLKISIPEKRTAKIYFYSHK